MRQGNPRVHIEAARGLCGLAEDLPWGCAVGHDIAGRLSRISFVRCGSQWGSTPASELAVGDRLKEDLDYHFVVDQILWDGERGQAAASLSGRGWLVLNHDDEVKAQR